MTRTALSLNFLFLLFVSLFLIPQPTQAIGVVDDSLPSFADFRRSMQSGEADTLRGIYVRDVLALPVVQQPADKPYYVSNHNGEATQFSIASQYGNIGLLAHNNLSGRFFSQLKFGQEVRLVYGDGSVKNFVIRQVLQFQALQPESVSSPFRNLDRTDEIISAAEMFSRVYTGASHVVFQTCIAAKGNASWGRLFVVAVPKE